MTSTLAAEGQKRPPAAIDEKQTEKVNATEDNLKSRTFRYEFTTAIETIKTLFPIPR